MASPAATLLPALDIIRGIRDTFGLNPYTVYVRVVTWTGTRVGLGTSSYVDTPVTLANGKRPTVREVKDRDVVAGGILSVTRFRIGPLTPPYTGGGMQSAVLDPPKVSAPTEMFYVLVSATTPTNGVLCRKVEDHFDRALSYYVIVETIGKPAPGTP